MIFECFWEQPDGFYVNYVDKAERHFILDWLTQQANRQAERQADKQTESKISPVSASHAASQSVYTLCKGINNTWKNL